MKNESKSALSASSVWEPECCSLPIRPPAPCTRWATVCTYSTDLQQNMTHIYCCSLFHNCVAMLRQFSTRGFQPGSNLIQNTDLSFPSTAGRKKSRNSVTVCWGNCLNTARKCAPSLNFCLQSILEVPLPSLACARRWSTFLFIAEKHLRLLSRYWCASEDTADRSTSERYANKI